MADRPIFRRDRQRGSFRRRARGGARERYAEIVVIGGGTNLIVSDAGFRGIVLRYRGDACGGQRARSRRRPARRCRIWWISPSRAAWQGLETLAGIPGSVGAAIYGNAGAYGHSIAERVLRVRFYDGQAVRFSPTMNASFNTARAFSSATRSGSSSRRNCGWKPAMPALCGRQPTGL